MPARMPRAQPVERRLQPVGQRVVGGVHAREQRVAAGRRDLARVEHRAERRRLVIAVVGMPAAADIARLLRLLAHLGDHRMAGHGREEPVDVDRAEALGDGDVLLRRQLLVAEEDDAVCSEGVPDFGEGLVDDRRRQIDPADFGPDMPRHRFDPDVVIAHNDTSARSPQSSISRVRIVCSTGLRNGARLPGPLPGNNLLPVRQSRSRYILRRVTLMAFTLERIFDRSAPHSRRRSRPGGPQEDLRTGQPRLHRSGFRRQAPAR